MELFKGQETRVYFENKKEQLKKKIESMTDVEITGTDSAEWKEYYYSHFAVQPIVLYEDAITQNLTETKVKQYNPFAGQYGEPKYYEVDGVAITYLIPFDGDPELLELRPSTFIMNKFPCERISKPYGEECGTITFRFEFVRRELEQHKDDMNEFVAKSIEQAFSSYRTMTGYLNADVNSFNGSLASVIERSLNKRMERASSLSMISQKLEIPLTKSKNAPNVLPVPLRRVKKELPNKPARKVTTPEYAIPESEYTNINNIIYMCGSAIEATAKSYITNGEEEFRDIFLATLNTHYDDVTGETFRKIGKTDIRILFENKAAFIGECKIWRGERAFSDAVHQLMSYSTWKDSKVSLLIFNKENQNFQGIVSKIDNWIRDNSKSFSKPKYNSWQCKYYREDTGVEVDLYVVVFDFYVDISKSYQ